LNKPFWSHGYVRTLAFVVVATLMIQRAWADSVTVTPGVLQEERTSLLQKIDDAKQSGCGVAGYMNAFVQLEAGVKSGMAEAELRGKIKAISDALEEQKKRSQLLKSRPMAIPYQPRESTRGPEAAHSAASTEKTIDYKPYIGQVERELKRAWFPPKGAGSKSVTVTFKIHHDGSVSDVQIKQSSGVSIVDDAALKAIRNAAPLRPPPAGSEDPLDFEFRFDYNAIHGF